ncbi:hypothetical protein JW911_03515 [Candidatus Peregrinibacteria bacterium]|nr:hypothetical protein [Candidatus Peregrinibacteria bacterium]
MTQNPTKIQKFIAEFALMIAGLALMLNFTGPIIRHADAAHGNFNDSFVIAQNDSLTFGLPGASTTQIIPISPVGYEQLPQLNASEPTSMLNQFVGGLVANLKYLLGGFAVVYIILAAVKLILAGGSEDTVTKAKSAITYGIIGLAVIGFADEMAKVIYVGGRASFLSSPSEMIQRSQIFSQAVQVFITFIKYIVGGIAVLMLVRNGIRLAALQGKEESVTLDKKNLAFTSLGLILIIMASTVIDKVLFVFNPSEYTPGADQAINPQKAVQELIGVTNIVVSIIAPIAILVLIAGAIMYATAGGNDEKMGKAKRMIMLAIVGMIIIYGAFAIISTVISGQFTA